jgi:hypothetical protein
LQEIGSYAFLLGIIIAIIATFLYPTVLSAPMWVPVLLIILGLIVGLLNITDKETTSFLVAAIALILTSGALAGLSAWGLGAISTLVAYIAIFVAPAALIVALLSVWKLAKSG